MGNVIFWPCVIHIPVYKISQIVAHVILTDCTGTAGSAVLTRCTASPNIPRISKRPVTQATRVENVVEIIHKDFNVYPNDLLEKLKGAVGCVYAKRFGHLSWASQRRVTRFDINSRSLSWLRLLSSGPRRNCSEYRIVTLDYLVAAATAVDDYIDVLEKRFEFLTAACRRFCIADHFASSMA